MKGPRIKAATAGAVLLSEVSRRANFPISLFAFNDQCTLVLDGSFEEAEGRIGGLLKAAAGGTELAKALGEVATHLERSNAQNQIVIVLGDGEDNAREVAFLLEQMEESGVVVMALGVGPNSEGMQNCFSRARTGLEPGAIPGALATLLRHAVTLSRG